MNAHLDECNGGDVFDGQVAAMLLQHRQHNLSPEAAIAELAQIRQWLLGRADFVFTSTQLVGERNEEFSIAVALVLREDQNASEIEVFWRFLFLISKTIEQTVSCG